MPRRTKPLDPSSLPGGISGGSRMIAGGAMSAAIRYLSVSGGQFTSTSPAAVVTTEMVFGSARMRSDAPGCGSALLIFELPFAGRRDADGRPRCGVGLCPSEGIKVNAPDEWVRAA